MSKSNGAGKEIHESKVVDPLNTPEFNKAIDKVVDDLFAKPVVSKPMIVFRTVISATTRLISRFFKFVKKRAK